MIVNVSCQFLQRCQHRSADQERRGDIDAVRGLEFNSTTSRDMVAVTASNGLTLSAWPNNVPVNAISSPADVNGVIVNVAEGIPATDPDIITVTVPRTNAVDGKLFGRVQAVK